MMDKWVNSRKLEIGQIGFSVPHEDDRKWMMTIGINPVIHTGYLCKIIELDFSDEFNPVNIRFLNGNYPDETEWVSDKSFIYKISLKEVEASLI